MPTSNTIETRSRPISSSPIGSILSPWFRGRRGLVTAALVLSLAGLVAGWPWLVAVGAAPLILSLAPCAVMCAIGVCAMSRGSGSPAQTATPSEPEKSGPSDATSKEDA